MIPAKRRIYSFIVAALLIQITVLAVSSQDSGASDQAEKPAYLITSGNVVAPEKMPAYLEASAPLFKAAGSEEIAFGKLSDGNIHLLEGEWPYKGLLMIIKFPSMDVLLKFWNSPQYKEAIKLRQGVVIPNFTVAIEKSR